MITLNEVKKFKSIISHGDFHDSSLIVPTTDSRVITNHNVFIAIQGEKYNPLNFLHQLKNYNSIKYIAYTKSFENDLIIKPFLNDFIFIETSDSILFLQELSRNISIKWQKEGRRNLIAISGSNGKTTTKEMLYYILKSALLEKVVCTQKNNNNHIGVPLTVFQINKNVLTAIVELGSNHPGEMKVVCEASAPNYGITTNIGYTHMEFFPTLEDVFLEEAYLEKYLTNEKDYETKIFFRNTKDHFLSQIKEHDKIQNLPNFIFNNDSKIKFQFENEMIEITNSFITGEHNFINLATSVYIALYLYPEFKNTFLAAASTFRPTTNRSQWIEFKNKPLFLDAYNANPSSMKAALLGFRDWLNAKNLKLDDAQVVLADMNELGQHAKALHGEIGELLNQLGFKHVVFIGKYADFYQNSFKGNAKKFKDVMDYKNTQFHNDLNNSKAFFIKGSRSLQLEKLIDIT